MHVAALEVEIRIPTAHSLKDRRQVVRHLVDGARQRFGVATAEVGGQDTWQRATLGFAVVASSVRVATETIDAVDRYLWAQPDIEILSAEIHWLDRSGRSIR